MQRPQNIDPEVLRRIIEQYQTTQVPTGIEPQGYPSYDILNNTISPQTSVDTQINTSFPQLQSLAELNELRRSGQINEQEYERLFETVPEFNYRNIPNQGVLTDFQQYTEESTPQTDFSNLFGSLGVGIDLDSALFNVGRFAGMDSDVSGRNLGLTSSIGKSLLGGARSLTSGLGVSKRNEFVRDYYNDRQRNVQYTPAPQYQNTNTTGGYSFGEQGGYFDGKGFSGNPKNVQNSFNGYNVGDSIKFKYGDKIEQGVIDRIENGQIFLK